MQQDNECKPQRYRWGKGPSELAVFIVKYLKESRLSRKMLSIIDIGCGYGRDEFYLSQNIQCAILGVDKSQEAIELAVDDVPKKYIEKIRFQCCDFLKLPGNDTYDIVFASTVYHLLKPEERVKFGQIMRAILKPEGLVFISTFSTRDPQHYGKGTPVADEMNSFIDRRYIHFYTGDGLEKDFEFLTIKELFEHEYEEHLTTGEIHHHISWLLAGQLKNGYSFLRGCP